MNRGPYGIISMICTACDGLPDRISRSDFDDILMGLGKVESTDTCRRKWEMLVSCGFLTEVGDDSCTVNADVILSKMQKYGNDIGFRIEGRFEEHSLLNDMLGRVANRGYDVIFFDDP